MKTGLFQLSVSCLLPAGNNHNGKLVKHLQNRRHPQLDKDLRIGEKADGLSLPLLVLAP